jgi:hypothetical protein
MFFVRSMGKIQPGHIHPQPHQVAKYRFRVASRPNRANDLGPAKNGNGPRPINASVVEPLQRLA